MKKLKSLMLLLTIMFYLKPIVVLGLENDTVVIKNYIDNVYYAQITNNNMRWSQYATFTANGKAAFCIGPGKSVTSTIYNSSTDWNVVDLPIAKINEIELIAYYGYNYPNHQTFTYYMATQKLLWESLGVDNAYYSDAGYGGGNIFRLDSEIENINTLISKHYLKPSFDETLLSGFIGDKFTLIDQNNEMNKFNITSENDHSITFEENALNITLDSYDENQIILTKGDKDTTIFTSINSQPMADFGSTTIKVDSKINIEILEGIIHVNFNDIFDFSVEGATYKIEKLIPAPLPIIDEEYCVDPNFEPIVFSINNENQATINDLRRGKYQITQITPKIGFVNDKEKYIFDVDEQHLEQTVFLNVKLILNDFIINKYINDEENGICEKESGIEFEIYLNGIKDGSLFTDENGRASVILRYGEYTIKQINTTEGYEKIDDFIVIIDNETDIEKYDLISNKIYSISLNEEVDEALPTNQNEISQNEIDELVVEKSNKIIEFEMPKTTTSDLTPIILLFILLICGIILIVRELKNEK